MGKYPTFILTRFILPLVCCFWRGYEDRKWLKLVKNCLNANKLLIESTNLFEIITLDETKKKYERNHKWIETKVIPP